MTVARQPDVLESCFGAFDHFEAVHCDEHNWALTLEVQSMQSTAVWGDIAISSTVRVHHLPTLRRDRCAAVRRAVEAAIGARACGAEKRVRTSTPVSPRCPKGWRGFFCVSGFEAQGMRQTDSDTYSASRTTDTYFQSNACQHRSRTGGEPFVPQLSGAQVVAHPGNSMIEQRRNCRLMRLGAWPTPRTCVSS
jgi:hypothetical protein